MDKHVNSIFLYMVYYVLVLSSDILSMKSVVLPHVLNHLHYRMQRKNFSFYAYITPYIHKCLNFYFNNNAVS